MICNSDSILLCIEWNDRKYRPEYLFIRRHIHCLCAFCQNSHREKCSIISLSAEYAFRALLDSMFHLILHVNRRFLCDQAADIRIGISGITDFDLLKSLDKKLGKLFNNAPLYQISFG